MRASVPILTALFVAAAAWPAAAECGISHTQQQASQTSVTAFLTEHGVTGFSPGVQMPARDAAGGSCVSDSDCGSGKCGSAAEGQTCVPK
jgi:hypothetical protein